MQSEESFKALITKELVGNKNNNYTDNWDYVSRGGYHAQPLTWKGLLKAIAGRILPSELYYNLIFNVKIKNHLTGLSFLYNNLANEHSKNLLVQVLTFRVMGHRKYRLPLSTKSYWDNLKTVEKLIVEREDTIDPNFMNVILYKHDLHPIGYPIKLYFSSLGILIDYVIKQYEYRQEGKVIKAEKGDVVIDAGGCWGDTALYFANEVGPDGKVYSFEFIPSNIEIYKKNVSLNPHLSENIKIIPNPVWETSGKELYYNNLGPGSKVLPYDFKGSAGKIVTLSIDDFVKKENLTKVDFIKMDIEGAESYSVRGAGETIIKHKPKLAIAVYHSISDFYSIASYLHSLNLGYKFYFQHTTIHAEESVLFAQIENG